MNRSGVLDSNVRIFGIGDSKMRDAVDLPTYLGGPHRIKLTAMKLKFIETARDGDARIGELTTRRITVETPAFMPVGTRASVKGLTSNEVSSTGAHIILANAFH